jgi:transcriptional regulator with XRE-family HTH domain
MTTGEYVAERRHARLTPAKSLRIARELQGLSQDELASLSGIPQPTISALENGQKGLGLERAKQLARVLRVHPAVLAFPDWEPQSNVVPLPLGPRPRPTIKRVAGMGRMARTGGYSTVVEEVPQRMRRRAARTRKKGAAPKKHGRKRA